MQRIVIGIAGALLAAAASAQTADTPGKGPGREGRKMDPEKMEQMFDQRFKAADKNGDGMLSREEAAAGMPRIAEHFDEIDTNKDGKLTVAEIQAWINKTRDERMVHRHDKKSGQN